VTNIKESEPSTQQREKEQPENPICCGSCGQVIVKRKRLSARTEGEEHTFRNPAGYSFHVITFSEAQGCRRTGVPTTRDSWFPGYAWSIVLCSECEKHLGWHFQKSHDSFHGLIVTRLTGL